MQCLPAFCTIAVYAWGFRKAIIIFVAAACRHNNNTTQYNTFGPATRHSNKSDRFKIVSNSTLTSDTDHKISDRPNKL